MVSFSVCSASEYLTCRKTHLFVHVLADSGLFMQGMMGGQLEYLQEFYCEYVPGVFSGECEILSCYVCGNVVGVAILKKSTEAREISIFFVLEEYRKVVVEELLNRSYVWLGTTRPIMTVQKGGIHFNYSKD